MAALPRRPQPTVDAFYAAYEARQGSGYRRHLGASLIGTECSRALWYTFRWVTSAKFTGRLLRLFDTGNLAEARFVADLRSIGCTVLEINPDTGRQWSVRAVRGHFGGSMDAVIQGIPEAPKKWHVAEFKTHNAKSYAALVKDGVEQSKPLHAAQMQIYMHLGQLDRALYMAVNKDTDELYTERLRADPAAAMRFLAKAERIIDSPRAPEKISKDPAWFQCRFCNHHAVCHEAALPERHCRSCVHSTPVDNGAWSCARHGGIIDADFEAHGCENHLYLPDFIAGEPVDSAHDTITYAMRDGTTWIDAGKVPF